MDDMQTATQEAEQFRRIWQRVKGEEEMWEVLSPAIAAPSVEPAAQGQAETLARMMDETAERSRLCRGWGALSELRRQSEGQLRRLAAAYYLLTGVRHEAQSELAPARRSQGEVCRALYVRFRQARSDYEQAAARTQDGELRALYHELAGECGVCVQRIRRMGEQTFSI